MIDLALVSAAEREAQHGDPAGHGGAVRDAALHHDHLAAVDDEVLHIDAMEGEAIEVHLAPDLLVKADGSRECGHRLLGEGQGGGEW